jgi:uncharacterized delta-60 repeat protein
MKTSCQSPAVLCVLLLKLLVSGAAAFDASPLPAPLPEIAVEQPQGRDIADGGTVSAGRTVLGATTSLSFTIKNQGAADLTGIAVLLDGADSAMFHLVASPAAVVAGPEGFTTFTVDFIPTSAGLKTAALHISNNDADEGPYDVVLTGLGATAVSEVDLTFNAGITSGDIMATAVQPDGNILIGGTFTSVGGQVRNRIARLHADGTVDLSFDPGTGAGAQVNAIVLQADGGIVIAGSFTTVAGVPHNRLARLLPGGGLDASFNPNVNGIVNSLALQGDGSILVGGAFTVVNGVVRNRVARLSGDGTLDAAFDPDAGADPADSVLALAVQADGLILIGGSFDTIGGVARSRIARLFANGTLDAGFNPGANNTVNTMAVQPDGRILVGGVFTSVAGVTRNRITRLLANGSSDTSFSPGTGANNAVNTLALQSNGRILVGGIFTTFGGVTHNRVVRLFAEGSLDGTFDPGADNTVNSLALQTDGQVLIGGSFTTVHGVARSRLARLGNDVATETLTAPSTVQVLWSRSGAAPEVSGVVFEVSTDGGASWSLLGNALPVSGGWELGGIHLSSGNWVRARGRASGGPTTAVQDWWSRWPPWGRELAMQDSRPSSTGACRR